MKKTLVFLVFVVAITFGAVQFIKYSNDHSHCDVTTETTTSEDGLTKVTTTRHSCNENYNL